MEGSLAERKGERGRSKRKAPSTKKLLVGGQLNPRMKLYIGITAVRSSPSSSVVVVSTEPQARGGGGGRGDETDVQISYCPDLLRRFLRLKILSIIPSCFSLLPSSEAQLGFSFYPSPSLAFLACLSLDQARPASSSSSCPGILRRKIRKLAPDFLHLSNPLSRVRSTKKCRNRSERKTHFRRIKPTSDELICHLPTTTTTIILRPLFLSVLPGRYLAPRD